MPYLSVYVLIVASKSLQIIPDLESTSVKTGFTRHRPCWIYIIRNRQLYTFVLGMQLHNNLEIVSRIAIVVKEIAANALPGSTLCMGYRLFLLEIKVVI